METTTIQPYDIRYAAITAAQEARRQNDEYQRDQQTKRVAVNIKDARDTFEHIFKLSLPENIEFVTAPESSVVRFAYQDLEFSYSGYVRGNGGLAVLVSCTGREDEEGRWVHEATQVPIGFLTLAELGEILGDVTSRASEIRRCCGECYRLGEDGGNFSVDTPRPRPRPLNALEHLTLAMRQIAEEVVQERTGA
jgi:hypothetical protein